MDWTQILGFTAVAALLVMSPGPNGILIARTVPLSGKKAGFANIAGFVAAFYVHGALSVLGISILITQSAQAFFVVKMLGAAYLCWIGLNALLSAWRDDKEIETASLAPVEVSLSKALGEGFLTNVLNPKVSMFYLAAFPQFIPQTGAAEHAFLLVFIHSMLNLVWFSGMVLLFSTLTQRAKSKAFQRFIKTSTGLVFVAFGAKLATLKV